MAQKNPSLLDKLKSVISGRTLKKEQEISTEWLKAQLQNFAPYSRRVKPTEVLSDKRNDPTSRILIG